MAGNNAIQFLRGDSSKRKASNESLLPGQPFYETNTNLFYIGGKEGTPLKTAEPIVVSGSEGIAYSISAGGTIRNYLDPLNVNPMYDSDNHNYPLMYVLILGRGNVNDSSATLSIYLGTDPTTSYVTLYSGQIKGNVGVIYFLVNSRDKDHISLTALSTGTMLGEIANKDFNFNQGDRPTVNVDFPYHGVSSYINYGFYKINGRTTKFTK